MSNEQNAADIAVVKALIKSNITLLSSLSVIFDIYTADSVNQTHKAVSSAQVMKLQIAENASELKLLLDIIDQPR